MKHSIDSNDARKDNYHYCSIDDNNPSESIKQEIETLMFRSGESRTSKLACILILLEIKSLIGWLEKSIHYPAEVS